MLLFNRFCGGKISENATPLSKIEESSKSLKYVTLLDRHPDGVLEMLLFNRLGGGKISENATPLSSQTLVRFAKAGIPNATFA